MVGAHCTASTVVDNRNIIDNLGKSTEIEVVVVMVKNNRIHIDVSFYNVDLNHLIDALATCTYFRLLEIGIK